MSSEREIGVEGTRPWPRELGRSGIATTAVALGLAALGRPGYLTVGHGRDFEDRSVEAMAAAHEAGMGVIVKEALANGLLTSRGQIDALARAAGRVGASEDAVALAAVLARPWVDTVLSGASTVAQLESNLAAVHVRWDESLEAELAPIVEQPEQYWKTRSSLPWT